MNKPAQTALFSPFGTGTLSLQNRIVMAPMTRGQSPGNVPGPEVAQYYRRRAAGGAGLLITECTFVEHPSANGFNDAPAFYGNEALAAWRHVVDEVHAAGGVIVPQIWHAGPSRPKGMAPHPEAPIIGPMDVFDKGQHLVRGMDIGEIHDVVHAFGQAAADAKSIGFDGVEIHGAHSYLIDSFLWHQTNQRKDEYGGLIGNRVRLACEIVAAVRDSVGKTFPIIFRFSQWKLTDYHARIARNPGELEQILLPLADAGVDIFHVSTRRFWEPAFSHSQLSLAGWTKKITGKPVIGVGGVGIDKPFSLDIFSGNVVSEPRSVELLEDYLEAGEFDLIAVGRALLADPNWSRKVKEGQSDQIIAFSSETLATLS